MIDREQIRAAISALGSEASDTFPGVASVLHALAIAVENHKEDELGNYCIPFVLAMLKQVRTEGEVL